MWLTLDQHENIKKLHQRGVKIQVIAESFNRSIRTIQNVLRGTVKGGFKSTGRKPIFSVRQKVRLEMVLKRYHYNSIKEIHQSFYPQVKYKTFYDNVRKIGFHLVNGLIRQILTKKNVQNRKDFCNLYVNHADSFWKRIIFADEVTFQNKKIIGRGKVLVSKVFKRKHTKPVQKIKFCTKQMFIVTMMYGRMPVFTPVPHRVNQFSFQQLIAENLSHYPGFRNRTFRILMDNASPHTAASTVRFFRNIRLTTLQGYPANSPDLNPIENLFAIMKSQWYKVSGLDSSNDITTKVNELKNRFITVEKVNSLVLSMPSRLRSCLAARGQHTKY